MTVDILQSFLRLQLFDVAGDDARLEKIREATATLQTAATESDSKFRDYFLAATQSAISNQDPAIVAAAAALEEKWNSYSGCFPSPPIALFRAMLLQAALGAADSSADKKACATLILRNILHRAKFEKELGIWSGLAKNLDAAHEATALAAWSDDAGLKKLSAKIDRTKLEAAILGAAGPHGADTKPGTNPNPHWTSENGPWQTEFAKRMVTVIGDAADQAISQASAANEKRLAQVGGVALRNRLLWWKEAGFSPSLKQAYGNLAPVAAGLLCAIDLDAQIPAYAPTSAEYFLRSMADGFASGEKTIAHWIKDFAVAPEKQIVAEKLGSGLPSQFLISTFATAGADKAPLAAAFEPKEQVSLGELAVIVFRELQALSQMKAV